MTNPLILLAVFAVVLAVAMAFTKIRRLPLLHLLIVISGAIFGVLIGALLSAPLGKLPSPYGNVLPLVVSLILMFVTAALLLSRVDTIVQAAPWLRRFGHDKPRPAAAGATEVAANPMAAQAVTGRQILVDTSVIIDGRLGDIAKAGFAPGKLLITRFVLAELQNIADSDQAMRRGRGRRGLEVLNELRQAEGVQTEIIDSDPTDIKEVDHKLVALAKQLGAEILTTDYNLNRVAAIEGVRVLNVNELSNAIRPVVLPGEELSVKIVQAGKERGQGVGYLPDGTMIVVDNGDKMIGQEVMTEVTRVFQTVAGKMIFATPKGKAGNANNGNGNGGGHSRQRRGRSQRPHQKPAHPSSTGQIEDRLIDQTNQTGVQPDVS